MMLVMKRLNRNGYIPNATVLARINKCRDERLQQQDQLTIHATDFDADPYILYTAMKLNVFAELELITDEIVMRELCIECDGILMAKNLSLKRNHQFLGKFKLAQPLKKNELGNLIVCDCRFHLGYTMLTLIRIHIFAYKNAGNKARLPIDSVSSPSKIADRLLHILQQTRNSLDFLIEAVKAPPQRTLKKVPINAIDCCCCCFIRSQSGVYALSSYIFWRCPEKRR